ncbi:MAG: glutamine synthetase, partial [Pseudomonas sp.]
EVGSQAFAVGSVTGLQPFFAELKAGMAALGIPCEAVMHEMGLSQYEVNFIHDDPLLIADQTFLFKYLLHEVALKHGLIAVCMAKPLSKMPGSSMHLHQSVVDQSGQNIFTDPGSLQPTAEFRHYLGGMQAHLGDLILLMAPNINSYQRYCHTYASPNNLCWSNDNRRTGLRVPASEPDARRVENRVPGADANPYLAVAASLAAGLYGIDHALEPDLPAQGEFEVPEDLRLSCTLHRAIRRLERSSMAREAFTDEFVEGYLACKRMELEHFLDEISPWERRFLGSVI